MSENRRTEPMRTGRLVEVEYDPFALAPLERVIPSSEAQREVWLAAQLSDEASLAFNESSSIELSGRLDLAALRQALSDLVVRHQMLRATLSPDGLELCIAEKLVLELQLSDLSASSLEQRAKALARHLAAEVETAFDLINGPLVRVSLLKLESELHQLVISAHHLVCDGWSFGVIAEDLAALYTAHCKGVPPALQPADRYADYVEAELSGRPPSEVDADEAYWLGRFRGEIPVLELPCDGRRPTLRSFGSRRHDTSIDVALVTELKKLGGQAGASLFSVLLSAFAALIGRLCGQNDVVIGVPTAGQSATGMNNLVGHCVNLVPVRTSIDSAAPGLELVRTTQATLLDAFDHQQYTFGTLLKKLQTPRDTSRLPLVSVMFNVDQSVPDETLGFHGLNARTSTNPRHFENFELFVNVTQVDGALQIECQYNTDLFDESTLKAWLRSYEALLRDLVAQPKTAVGRLNLVPTEQRALQQAWNSTTQPYARDGLVHALALAAAERTPDAVALRDTLGTVSFAQLRSRVHRLARALRARGVGRSQLVGLCVRRGIEMVVAQLAVLEAGAAYVPLDPAFPAERLTYMTQDARLVLLVTESALASTLTWPREKSLWLDADAQAIAAQPDLAPAADPLLDARPESAAYVIYTSGSTGKPKGVVVPHRAVVNFLLSMAREPGLASADCLVAVTTLSFDIAVLELLLPLSVGAQVILASQEQANDGAALRTLLESSAASVMQATPATWRMLIEAGWQGGATFKALVGGEGLPPDLCEQLLARSGELWNMYGPTETTVWSTCWRVLPSKRGISIGAPIANTQVWILDEHQQMCPIGVPGEIYIGGDGVTLGYLHRPELTAERFIADPFGAPHQKLYRTGDRGRWRNDGLLEHLGRLDFQVKVRGYRIELGEIEAACSEFAGVGQAVLLAREDNPGDVRLVAYLTQAGGVPHDEAALRAHLRTRLPAYMLPQHIVVLDAIPLLPNGKVNRKALPAPEIGQAANAERVAPRTDLERSVACAMQAVLKLPDLGIHDDFFSLGGHSLLAARLVGQLNRDLDVQLSLRTLFESPTVEKLAVAIDRHRGAPPGPKREPIVRRAQQARAPLSLMQERMRFIEEMFPGRIDYNTPSAHRLKGRLDLHAFDRAFAQMVARQPSLRTRIVATNTGYEQSVEDTIQVSLLPLEDLSGIPEPEREPALKARLDALMTQTFVLDQAPLFKVRLFKLGEDHHVLFFMAHHIVWDGWSFDLLYAEMSAHYEACLQGRPSELAPLPVSYGDFAAWHGRWLDSDEVQQQLHYWKEQYAQGEAPRQPITDKPREPGSAGVGATAWIKLEPAQAERVRDLAKKTGTTLSIVTMAAFAAVMAQWLDDRRPTIGLPVRGRPAAELEGIMGFFNNMLPMRMPVETSLSGLDWIKRVRDMLVKGYAYQDVPFELVAKELERNRRGAAGRLYHVMYTFQDVRQRPTNWGPLAHARIPIDVKGSTEDVNFWLVDSPAGIVGGVAYNSEIFLAQTGELLRDRFVAVLEQLVSDPRTTMAQMLVVSESERKLLRTWSEPAQAAGDDALDAIATRIVQLPERVALVHGARSIRYAELGQQLASAERAIRARSPGELGTVAVATADPLVQVLASLAVLRLGGHCLTLDPLAPPDALRSALHIAAPKLLIGDAGVRELALTTPWLDALALGAQTLGTPSGMTSLAPSEPALDDTLPQPQRAPDRRLVNEALAVLRHEFTLHEDDALLTLREPRRGLALFDALLALSAGARWLVAEPRDATDLPALIRNQRVTLVRASAPVWARMLSVNGGAPLHVIAALDVREIAPPLAKDLFDAGCRVFSALHSDEYGLAVAGGWLAGAADVGLFGRPLLPAAAEAALAIVDSQGQPVPPGVPGMLQWRRAGEPVCPLGVPCRWRSDGVLQYLGVPEADLGRIGELEPRRADAAAAITEDLTPTELAVAEVWETLLSVDGVSRADNFFELGGTSLMAMQAAGLLEQRLGRRISARRYVFDSLGQIAAAYDEVAPMLTPQAAAIPGDVGANAGRGLLKRLAGLVRRA